MLISSSNQPVPPVLPRLHARLPNDKKRPTKDSVSWPHQVNRVTQKRVLPRFQRVFAGHRTGMQEGMTVTKADNLHAHRRLQRELVRFLPSRWRTGENSRSHRPQTKVTKSSAAQVLSLRASAGLLSCEKMDIVTSNNQKRRRALRLFQREFVGHPQGRVRQCHHPL